MVTLLVILALLIAVGATASLTQATLGVGLVALACLLAIFARLAQASARVCHGERC
jgi:hypothetical protein